VFAVSLVLPELTESTEPPETSVIWALLEPRVTLEPLVPTESTVPSEMLVSLV